MKRISLLLIMAMTLISCEKLQGKAPEMEDLGIRIVGRKVAFKPCPKKPNCVSSFAEGNDEKNILPPIKTNADRDAAYEAAVKIILNAKNANVVRRAEHYLQAEYKSSLLGFVDDVELYFGQKGFVHFKSASRTGFYDLGANKKRMEEFKFKFHQSGL